VTNQKWTLLSGAALGASAMYLLDPRGGARRRALIRDKVVRATHKTGDALDALGRDAANRARGVAAEARNRLASDTPDARRLQERVRAELGRVVSHPRAIDVYVSADGVVCLAGPVLMEEADRAISSIQGVKGVKEVDDRLERHSSEAGIPALQGGATRPGRRFPLMQASWSPTTKALVCMGSTALAVGLGYVGMSGRGQNYTDLHSARAS
jgi:osmotically-inducible protein OsmY